MQLDAGNLIDFYERRLVRRRGGYLSAAFKAAVARVPGLRVLDTALPFPI